MADLSLVPASGLGGDGLAQAARLNLAAMADMYATLPTDRALDIIASDLANADGELGTSLAALSDSGEVIGFYAGYAANELPARQQSSLYDTMSMLSGDEMPGFVANARALSGTLPALDRPGYYLARIAVDPSAKGSGLGRDLLAHFVEAACRRGAEEAFLLVRTDNSRAIAFYKRAGFETTAATERFAIMALPLAPEAEH